MYKDPPEGSPAHDMMAPNIGMTQKQLNRELGRDCDGCGKKQESEGEFRRCSACRRAVYCGPACQKADWAKHKPECLQARGEEVADEDKQAAEAARKEKEARMNRAHQARIDAELRAFVPGSLSHDCEGVVRARDLPWFGEDMLVTFGQKHGIEGEKLNLVVMPPGIPAQRERKRCIAYRCERTKRDLIVFFTPLFADGGEGTHDGTAIDSAFRRKEASDDLFKGKLFVEVPLGADPGVPMLDRIMDLLAAMAG